MKVINPTTGEEGSLEDYLAYISRDRSGDPPLPPIQTGPLEDGHVWCINGCPSYFRGEGGGCASCEVQCMRGRCHPGCRLCGGSNAN